MSKIKLTKTRVEDLLAGTTIWDTEVAGFGARRQRRVAIYVLKYRFRGRQRFITIGPHGAPWTVETARTEARRLLGLLASKEVPRDPAAERDLSKAKPTFAAFAKRYVTEYATVHKKPRTVAEDQRNLRLHLLPAFGPKQLDEITYADVARYHAQRRNHPVNANRSVATLSHMLTIAAKWGLIPRGQNPCREVERYRERTRERLLNSEELARLGTALQQSERPAEVAEGRARQSAEDWRAVACIRLLVLTGARLSEILTLQWSWIDWDRGVARLPDSKTGAKNLPLPAPALAIVQDLPKTVGSPYVLPGDRVSSHFIGIQKPWQRVRALAGLDDVRLHDLRHAFASIAVASGDSLYLVGKVLGHRQASTTERYAHLQPDPVKAVADRTSSRIAEMLGTPKRQSSG